MWPGQQPPGGEQNPQDPNQSPYQQPGYQQPNPYTQPGYQQQGTPPPPPGAPQPPATPPPGTPPPGPYPQGAPQQGVPQWNVPTAPMSQPEPPGDNRKKTTITAIVAATAVVIAAGVTGFLVLGKDDDGQKDEAKGGEKKPSSSAPASPTQEPQPTDTDAGRGNGPDIKPVIPGWQVVVNPKRGTAFDVPKDWVVKEPSMMTSYIDAKTEKPVTSMTGVAEYKPEWCEYDDDKDGRKSSWKLAGAGTKGANGARNTDEAAEKVVGWWVYGPYTQPSQKIIGLSKPSKYKSKVTGLEGSIAYAESQGVPKSKNPCATEGKALSFAFKNKANDFVVWSIYGPKDIDDEVSEATIKKILSSVRLAGMPQG